MRWLYLANARIPSEKAHVYQILQMVDALTSMKLAVDGLLRECRLELGERVA